MKLKPVILSKINRIICKLKCLVVGCFFLSSIFSGAGFAADSAEDEKSPSVPHQNPRVGSAGYNYLSDSGTTGLIDAWPVIGTDVGDEEPHYDTRVDVAGYNFVAGSGTTGLVDALLPLMQSPSNLLYANIRALTQFSRPFETDIGLGYRQLSQDQQSMVGGYIFYDRRETENRNVFNQITAGGEYWHKKFYSGFTAYIPVGQSEKLFSEQEGPILVDVDENRRNIFMGSRDFEKAMTGFDVELGYEALPGLIAYGGGYAFFAKEVGSVVGPRARVQYDFKNLLGDFGNMDKVSLDRLALESEARHDALRGTEVFVGLRTRMRFGSSHAQDEQRKQGVIDKMTSLARHDINLVPTSVHRQLGDPLLNDRGDALLIGDVHNEGQLTEVVAPEEKVDVIAAHDEFDVGEQVDLLPNQVLTSGDFDFMYNGDDYLVKLSDGATLNTAAGLGLGGNNIVRDITVNSEGPWSLQSTYNTIGHTTIDNVTTNAGMRFVSEHEDNPNLTISNSDFNLQGDHSIGIDVTGEGVDFKVSDSEIHIEGDDSMGIRADDSIAQLSNMNIGVTGNNAIGVRAGANIDNSVIMATGGGSDVNAVYSIDKDVNITGSTIMATADADNGRAWGVSADGDASVTDSKITVDASVHATGIFASDDANVTNSTITATGDNTATGVFADEATIENGSTITATGNTAIGVDANMEAVGAGNNITATGDTAIGLKGKLTSNDGRIIATNNSEDVSPKDTINAIGNHATGVLGDVETIGENGRAIGVGEDSVGIIGDVTTLDGTARGKDGGTGIVGNVETIGENGRAVGVGEGSAGIISDVTTLDGTARGKDGGSGIVGDVETIGETGRAIGVGEGSLGAETVETNHGAINGINGGTGATTVGTNQTDGQINGDGAGSLGAENLTANLGDVRGDNGATGVATLVTNQGSIVGNSGGTGVDSVVLNVSTIKGQDGGTGANSVDNNLNTITGETGGTGAGSVTTNNGLIEGQMGGTGANTVQTNETIARIIGDGENSLGAGTVETNSGNVLGENGGTGVTTVVTNDQVGVILGDGLGSLGADNVESNHGSINSINGGTGANTVATNEENGDVNGSGEGNLGANIITSNLGQVTGQTGGTGANTVVTNEAEGQIIGIGEGSVGADTVDTNRGSITNSNGGTGANTIVNDETDN